MNKPIIGIVAVHKFVDKHDSQNVNHKYLSAVVNYGGVPIVLPAQLAETFEGLDDVLAALSGVVLTGDYSNVAPERYGAQHVEEKTDVARDALSFSIIEKAKKSGLPILGVCRGHQEINVAYGGTLHPKLYEVDGLLEHREDNDQPHEVQYADIQQLQVTGEWLKTLVNADTISVNTLHGQGVNRLGDDLSVEAKAPDGIVECIKATNHPFMIGTQWHIEWKPEAHPIHAEIWKAFIEAARHYHDN